MDTIGAIEKAHDFMVAGTAPDSLTGMCESTWKPDLVRLPGGLALRRVALGPLAVQVLSACCTSLTPLSQA